VKLSQVLRGLARLFPRECPKGNPRYHDVYFRHRRAVHEAARHGQVGLALRGHAVGDVADDGGVDQGGQHLGLAGEPFDGDICRPPQDLQRDWPAVQEVAAAKHRKPTARSPAKGIGPCYSRLMRRTLPIVVLIIVVSGLGLYWRTFKDTSKRAPEPNAVAIGSTSAPPRMALPAPKSGATSLQASSATQNRDTTPDVRALAQEEALMQQLRAALTTNPPLAEELARQGRERFPDSASADERDMLLVGAVFNQGMIERSRVEAYSYFARHPRGLFTKDLAKLTGATPPSQEGH
jgi:hypothetical protein